MYYELQNNPTDPISLADAKEFLRIDSDMMADDDLVTALISSAVDWGEGYTNRDFSNKQWIGYFSNLCTSRYEPYAFLPIKKSPMTALTSVEISSAGSYAATSDYIRKQTNGYDLIEFTEAVTLDETVPYTFKITFESGYASLPASIKTALLQHISFLYENRADAPTEPPVQVRILYGRHKLIAGYA